MKLAALTRQYSEDNEALRLELQAANQAHNECDQHIAGLQNQCEQGAAVIFQLRKDKAAFDFKIRAMGPAMSAAQSQLLHVSTLITLITLIVLITLITLII